MFMDALFCFKYDKINCVLARLLTTPKVAGDENI